MNRFYLTLFALSALFLTACDEVDKLLTFNITKSQTFTVPAQIILPGAQIASLPLTVQSNAEEEFKNNKTQSSFVKDVTLDKLILTVENPADEDFGFMRDIEIYIDAEDADEVKVAYLNDIPANVGKTLELNSTNENLDKYIKASSFTVRTRAATDEAVMQDVTIKMDMTFKVTADPL